MSTGGFAGIVMPLVGVFCFVLLFFLLTSDITVAAKFCSITLAVLYKNIVLPSTPVLLSPLKSNTAIYLHTVAPRPFPLMGFCSRTGSRPQWAW